MLDEDDGGARDRTHLEQDLRELGRLGGVEARGRLVEQQQQRLLDERPTQLHEPALALAQRLDRVVGDALEAELGQERLRPGHRGSGLAATDQVLPEPPVAAVDPLRDHEVLARGHAGEELETLESAPDARPGTGVDREAVDAPALEADLSRVAAAHAVQAVEQRRLPGAVGPDEADRLAAVDLDRDVVEGDDATEALADPRSLQQRHRQPTTWACLRQATTSSTARRFCHSTMPSGCSA